MKLCLLARVTCVVTICLNAQTPTASVVGRVVDPSGAVVPGVAVKVTSVDTNQSHGDRARFQRSRPLTCSPTSQTRSTTPERSRCGAA